MKFKFAYLLLFCFCSSGLFAYPVTYGNKTVNTSFARKVTTYVYICVSESAYAYHLDADCRGLKRCKAEKRKVTLTEAKNKYKRKICGYED